MKKDETLEPRIIRRRKKRRPIVGQLPPPRIRKKRRIRRAPRDIPDIIIPFRNQDKTYHEKWIPGRNAMNIPHPFRCLLLGPPNSGKTNIIKNFLLKADPQFERVVIIHCTPDLTNEYDDCTGAEIIGEIPPREFFDSSQKNLVILEDLDYNRLSRDQKTRLDRLYGNWSTHGNISVCTTSQDFYGLDTGPRRCTNLFILWKPVDDSVLPTVARRVGVPVDKLMSLFSLCGNSHDSVWVDKTDGTPLPIRLNCYDIPFSCHL